MNHMKNQSSMITSTSATTGPADGSKLIRRYSRSIGAHGCDLVYLGSKKNAPNNLVVIRGTVQGFGGMMFHFLAHVSSLNPKSMR